MPYIPQEERADLDELAGALVTQLRNGNFRGANGVSYSFLNDFIGVLECVKLELYRRVMTPYEDGKINENGDVFRAIKPVVSELGKKLSQDKAQWTELDSLDL